MKKILVVGAGYLQSFAIRKAKELGYHVLSVDGNPGAMGFCYADEHETIDIVDEEACLRYARRKGIDGVVTAATDFSVLTVSRIAGDLGLPGLDYEAAKTVKNKYLIRKRLFEARADDTEQAYEVCSVEQAEAIADKVTFPVMVKPCDGSGSRGASKVLEKGGLKEACGEAMRNSISHKALIESFIEGREYGVESFVLGGEVHVLGVMKKWMTRPPFYAELGHAYPAGLPAALESKVKDCVRNAIKAIGINYGPVNMDVLITDGGGVHVIDVGARMGGNLIYSHVIPLGTGVDYPGNVIRAAVGDGVSFAETAKTPVATALLALTPGEVVAYPDVERFRQEKGLSYMSFLKQRGDMITPYRTNLDGCGYVVVTGEEVEECHRWAFEARDCFDREIVRKA